MRIEQTHRRPGIFEAFLLAYLLADTACSAANTITSNAVDGCSHVFIGAHHLEHE